MKPCGHAASVDFVENQSQVSHKLPGHLDNFLRIAKSCHTCPQGRRRLFARARTFQTKTGSPGHTLRLPRKTLKELN